MKHIQSGFTLVELMVSVSLCILLYSVSMVSVQLLEKTMVQMEMNLLCAACNHLQQQAIATNAIQELSFNAARSSYAFNGNEHALAKGVCFDVALDAYGPPSAPYHILEKPITFKENKIFFYPEGIMSAGMICFTNSARTILCALSSAVAHASFVRRYRYDGKWHSIS
jgi:type II secretory pathway pseudopilin PulG